MVLLLVAYLGGVLTIVSPCILPVLPFVFARADQPFIKSGLPLLLGMAVTFAGVATLAAVGLKDVDSSPCLQGSLELLASAEQSGLHSGQRQLHRLGNLFVGKSFDLTQHDECAIGFIQRAERAA